MAIGILTSSVNTAKKLLEVTICRARSICQTEDKPTVEDADNEVVDQTDAPFHCRSSHFQTLREIACAQKNTPTGQFIPMKDRKWEL